MLCCGRCQVEMRSLRQGKMNSWRCTQCEGRAASLSSLRRLSKQPSQVVEFWRGAHSAPMGSASCPACQHPMREVNPSGGLALDICRRCMMIWFDPGEWESLLGPEDVPAPGSAGPAPAAGPAPGSGRSSAGATSSYSPSPDTRYLGWAAVLGHLGIPVEVDASERHSLPLLSWSLVALLWLVGTLLYLWMPTLESQLILVPTEPLAHAGLPLLAHILVPWDVFGLLLVTWALLVAGDDVEHVLGSAKFLAMIALVAGLESLLAVVFAAGNDSQVFGSTGLATCVVVFYTLQFPLRQVFITYRWELGFKLGERQILKMPLIMGYGLLFCLLGLASLSIEGQWGVVAFSQATLLGQLVGAWVAVGMWGLGIPMARQRKRPRAPEG